MCAIATRCVSFLIATVMSAAAKSTPVVMTAQQQAIVNHVAGPGVRVPIARVNAAAGSGKTTVMVQIALALLQKGHREVRLKQARHFYPTSHSTPAKQATQPHVNLSS